MMNLFEDAIDRTDLVWTLSRDSSGTAGSYLKSYEIVEGRKIYYKMSRYDSRRGIIGHESINEIICMNIANQLGFDTLQYEPIYCKVKVNDSVFKTIITKSYDFKRPGDKTLSLEDYCDIVHQKDQTSLDIFLALDEEYCYAMLVLDYLIFNRDRHGANVEVLYNNGQYRLAPLFDHGLSFMCSCETESDFEGFDIMKTGPVNNYIGYFDVEKNLQYVPKVFIEGLRKPTDIFAGMDTIKLCMPEIFWSKTKEMFDRRFDYVKKL